MPPETKKTHSERPKPAPAPPPPPELAEAMASGSSPRGFNPKGRWVALELALAALALVTMGMGAVFFGGIMASWMTPLIPMSLDQKLGELSQKQLSLSTKECSNPAAQEYVEELARRLLDQAGELPFEFSFRVADTPEVNAFALPGGFVTVNRGLLESANSGEEVAGVLGHEIQHALLRHGTKRILRQLGGRGLLSLVLGGTDWQFYGQMAASLNELSYDRAQESEADERGVALLRASTVDPSGLATFFKRLEEGAVTPPAILSTHPDPGDRARWIEEASKGGKFQKLPSPEGIACHLEGGA